MFGSLRIGGLLLRQARLVVNLCFNCYASLCYTSLVGTWRRSSGG